MEGLIPMVFKAIKKNRIRNQYQCLSTGAIQDYNIADFYRFNDHRDRDRDRDREFHTPPMETRGRHRRFASTGGYEINGGNSFKYDREANGNAVGYSSPPPMQLKRFRSHRMFSCVTGAS